MFIVDAHLDIAYGALKFNRPFWSSLSALRAAERNQPSPNGIATIAGPELLQAGIGLVFGSVFLMPANSPLNRYPHPQTSYADANEAHHNGMRQLDYYHRLADEQDEVQLVGDRTALRRVIASHQGDKPEKRLLGIVPALEGADPIRHPEEVELWFERGIRAVGLAWDDTQYAAGAWQARGGLSKRGRALLEAMADYQIIVDLTHMSEKAALETLDLYEGVVVATHSPVRALLSDNERFLSNTQIQRIGERGGVIGIPLANVFLRKGHTPGAHKSQVSLAHLVDHIDHVCQVLGSADNVGLGSDLDGGFGKADIPVEMDSVLEMPLIATALEERGYEPNHVSRIMSGNWINLLRDCWEDA